MMSQGSHRLLAAPVRSAVDLLDLMGRSLLIGLMLVTARGCLDRLTDLPDSWSVSYTLACLNQVGSLLFALLVGTLVILRRPIQVRSQGAIPQLCAVGAAFILCLVAYLPEAPLPARLSLVATSLMAVGNLGTVYCLAWLGRSFSLLPQARGLVTSGPYAWVRHPLYLAEFIATIGLILAHVSAVAVAAGVVQCGLQYIRLGYEEQVLAQAFPRYASYAATTPRLCPRLPWPRRRCR